GSLLAAVDDRLRESCQCLLHGAIRQRLESRDGVFCPPVSFGEGTGGYWVLSKFGDCRGEIDGCLTIGSAGRFGLDAGQERGGLVIGLGENTEVDEREGRDTGAEVGARHLSGFFRLRRQVDDVVDELERDTDLLAVLDDGWFVRFVRAGEDDSGLRGSGDERTGLVCEHLEVVRLFVLAVLG